MKIYTKTGDGGETGLFGAQRVPKDHRRIEAYGTVDELNAALGAAQALHSGAMLTPVLEQLQRDLFVLGADLAAPRSASRGAVPRISEEHVQSIERIIDKLESGLPPLSSFIVPGGSPIGAQLHVARTICRRAERSVVALSHAEDLGPNILPYLNRLSDLLFVMARAANRESGTHEKTWSGKQE